MPATASLAYLPEVTDPLGELVPQRCRHYFTGDADIRNYKARCYSFGGSVQYLPLVRAFLNTCAATRSEDYRYLFTLLGSELANNAVEHSRSGEPYGTYTLKCERRDGGLKLTCRDQGARDGEQAECDRRSYLRPRPNGLDLTAESGRGLALINALATSWGDNGIPDHRQVWFFLASDLTDNLWNTAV
ncbi:ATP-binding protein [Nocardiopsis alborubida]|uniref:ATP-binding protein n=1 Tax=Nocardiopsis alborubida TaxID=146802 RepID=A0A7X6MHB1_9ACTN|nr:ATP-binding protein [Nocardiopsis alborubida]NKZ01338.1 ATP-binding protein [Nocardiopsis alborubida]